MKIDIKKRWTSMTIDGNRTKIKACKVKKRSSLFFSGTGRCWLVVGTGVYCGGELRIGTLQSGFCSMYVPPYTAERRANACQVGGKKVETRAVRRKYEVGCVMRCRVQSAKSKRATGFD